MITANIKLNNGVIISIENDNPIISTEGLFSVSRKDLDKYSNQIKILDNEINKNKDKFQNIFDICIGPNSRKHLITRYGVMDNLFDASPYKEDVAIRSLINFINKRKKIHESEVIISSFLFRSYKEYIIYMKIRQIDYEDASSAEREVLSYKKHEEIKKILSGISINGINPIFEVSFSYPYGFYIILRL